MAFELSEGTTCGYASGYSYDIVVDGILYHLAGAKTSDANALTTLERYDIENDSWSEGAVLPQVTMSHGCVYHNGYIYVFGGSSAWLGTFYTDVHRYSISGNSWTSDGDLTDMTEARTQFGCTRWGDYAYIVKGEYGTSNDQQRATILRYDLTNDTWNNNLTSDPTGVSAQADAIAVNGKIYYYGGRYWTGGAYTRTNTMRIYDISGDSWSAGTAGKYAFQNYRCWAYGGYIFYVPGWTRQVSDDSLANKSGYVFIYDTATDSWLNNGEGTVLSTPDNVTSNFAYIRGRGTYKNKVFIINCGYEIDSTDSLEFTTRSVYLDMDELLRGGNGVYNLNDKHLFASRGDIRSNGGVLAC